MARKREFDFDDMLGTRPKPSVGESRKSRITEIQEPVSTGDQESSAAARESTGSEDRAALISALLQDHAGLRTGTAKKTTFDFTPDFARALKRWSVDTDMSMRDLVVRAVAQAMPLEYLQKYTRFTGIGKASKNPS